MKKKDTLLIDKENSLKNSKTKYRSLIVEDIWKKRKKDCEKNFSKFC